MKIFAGGPLDLVDATRPIYAGGAKLDLDLLRRVAEAYGRNTAISLDRLVEGCGIKFQF
jgi:hypothetical protein